MTRRYSPAALPSMCAECQGTNDGHYSTCSKYGGSKSDNVNRPRHYNVHPSGVECVTIVEHMSFNVGNAIKYLWRADEKGAPIEDLKKAAWYVAREIERREKCVSTSTAKS